MNFNNFNDDFVLNWWTVMCQLSADFVCELAAKSIWVRDNFFTLILKYLLPAPCIDSLDNLKDFYGIRFFFNKVKIIEISLQRFHITYKRRCEILHNISIPDSSVGRAIGYYSEVKVKGLSLIGEGIVFLIILYVIWNLWSEISETFTLLKKNLIP